MSDKVGKHPQSKQKSADDSPKPRGNDALFRTMTAEEWGKLQAFLGSDQATPEPEAAPEKDELSFDGFPQQGPVPAPSQHNMPNSPSAQYQQSHLPSSREFSRDHLRDPHHAHIPQEGTVLKGTYRLNRLIYEGKVGRLFQAEHVQFGGTYALKLFHPGLVQPPQHLQAYIRTIRANEKLYHPGIVRPFLIDQEPHTRATYYLMEWFQGMSLAQAIELRKKSDKQAPFTADELFQFMKELVAPIRYAHNKNAFCCNLHPSHILKIEDREFPIRLLNFAHPMSASSTSSSPGIGGDSLNALYYAAPELRDPTKPVTAATDIFSIGVVLYQMLTGNLPVGIAQPPSRVFPTWNTAVDDVVGKATQPDWQERYQTVDALLDGLRDALQQTGTSSFAQTSYSSPAVATTGTTSNRFRSTVPTSTHDSQHPSQPPQRTRNVSREELHASNAPKAPSLPKQRVGARSSAERPTVRPPSLRTGSQPSIRPPKMHSSAETPTVRHQRPTSGRRTTTKPQHVDQIGPISRTGSRPVASPSRPTQSRPAREAAPSSAQPRVPAPPRTRKTSPSSRPTASPSHPTQSTPAATTARATRSSTPTTANFPDTPVMNWEAHEAPITSASVSPDGTYLASAGEDNTLKVWSTSGWSLLYNIDTSGSLSQHLAWSHNQRYLAFANEHAQLEVWDLQNQQRCHQFQAHTHIRHITWNPNGHHIYTAMSDGTIAIWHLALGRQSGQMEGHDGPINALVFAHKEDWVLSASHDQTIVIWQISRKQKLKELCQTDAFPTALALSAQQSHLIAGHENGELSLFAFPQGTKQNTFRGHDDFIRDIQFAPNGQAFVTASEDATIKFWSTNKQTPLHSISHHQGPVHSIGLHPKGQWMVSASQDNQLCIWDTTKLLHID